MHRDREQVAHVRSAITVPFAYISSIESRPYSDILGPKGTPRSPIQGSHTWPKLAKVWNIPGWDKVGIEATNPNSIPTFYHPKPRPTTLAF